MQDTFLNLIPGACSPEVHLSQYDKGRAIPFKLAEGKSAYSVPDGSEIVVQATKPSGLGFVVPVTFDGDTATMTITETMSNEYGRFPAELSITNNGNRIGTANFVMNIERSPHAEGTIDGDAESLLPELTLLVERVEAAADSVDEDTQTVTEAKAEVLQAKADTLQAKADTLSAKADALQAKADAITAKESAEASAQAAAESAQEAEDTLSEYAKVDGYYEEMAVGSAEQLLSTQFVEDSVPYKFRTSGGSKDIGNREYDEIVGGSIVWNQRFRHNASASGLTITQNADGSLTINGTGTSNAITIGRDITDVQNHKLLFWNNGGLALYMGYGSPTPQGGGIINHTWGKNASVYLYGANGRTFNDFKVTVQAFDLTQMFGSTIADYIYSLETAQSGKGVAFFKSLFPNDYYPYNAGELLSVEGLQSHDTVGFNQWDEEWELGGINLTTGQNQVNASYVRSTNYIPVFPSTLYCGTCQHGEELLMFFYDANKEYLSAYQYARPTFTTPSGCHYVRFYVGSSSYGTTYKNDICINLSWSGTHNGEYEPYKKHSYPLDSSLTLRGILKLNAQNELYFDGDIYSHVGKVLRRMGSLALGDLTWAKETNGNRFSATIPNTFKQISGGTVANAFVSGYKVSSRDFILSTNDAFSIHYSQGANYINIHDDNAYANMTAEQFKTYLSHSYLVCELQTPTEETAEPFEEVQIVDDFGTEEYISGNIVPVGHNTKYPANLRDKLQHLPNMADSDGAYLIRQTNKQMSLELFRIPKAPTTDGTYTLKATVSGGTPTYVWEAVE